MTITLRGVPAGKLSREFVTSSLPPPSPGLPLNDNNNQFTTLAHTHTHTHTNLPIMAPATKSAEFTTAVEDSRKLKEKPTNDQLLEVGYTHVVNREVVQC